MINWSRPIRVKLTEEPARLLALHRDQAFITWGIRELSAVEVCATTGKWKDADIYVENVPTEEHEMSDAAEEAEFEERRPPKNPAELERLARAHFDRMKNSGREPWSGVVVDVLLAFADVNRRIEALESKEGP